MLLIAVVMLGIDGLFGNPVKSVHFNVNDVFAFVDPAVLRAAIARLREGKEASPAHLVLTFFHTAGTLLFAWVYLATSVKRLHDRDRSGWWIVPFFVMPGLFSQFSDLLPDSNWVLAIVLVMQVSWLWGFVEMFCLRGSLGSNRFGPDPLAEVEDNSASTPPSQKSWDQQSELEIVPPSASPPGGMHVKRST
jgi:uncharacterized membrane protein YhaH (DUF805 family)